jgi:hypothetical protein
MAPAPEQSESTTEVTTMKRPALLLELSMRCGFLWFWFLGPALLQYFVRKASNFAGGFGFRSCRRCSMLAVQQYRLLALTARLASCGRRYRPFRFSRLNVVTLANPPHLWAVSTAPIHLPVCS